MSPIILVRGPEAALGDRAVEDVRRGAQNADPNVEITVATTVGYTPGKLGALVAPSLFEEPRLVILDDCDKAGDACVKEILEYIRTPEPGVTLTLRHRGGSKNRRLIDAAKKAGAKVIDCETVKKDTAKVSLAIEEAKRRGGTISQRAATHIVDAVGSSLYEVLGAVRQLVSDFGPRVADEDVFSFFAGQTEASAFEVADAIAAGQGPRALILYRQARLVGVEDIPLLGAIALKFRDMALASTSQAPAGWRGRSARENARKWGDRALGLAIQRLAEADSILKGAPGSAEHAIEKCIIDLTRIGAGG